MAHAGELIINSLLCFVSSAKADHTNESLIEIINSFYSHEEIKAAKVELANILKRTLYGVEIPIKNERI